MKRKFKFSLMLVCVALLALTGCTNSLVKVVTESTDNEGITVKKVEDGYAYLEMDVHSTVMKQLENRSILPEVGTLYYTVVGIYTQTVPNAEDQVCIDNIATFTSAADYSLAFTDSTTGIARLKMRVGGFWGISVIGTTVDYSTTTDYYTSNSTYWTDADAAHTYSDRQAVTLAIAGKAVNAYKCFYIDSSGNIMDGNNTSNNAETTFTVSTSTNGTGSISLPILCEAGTDSKTIASYCMVFSAISIASGETAPSNITGTVTEGTEFTIELDSVPAGTYNVQIFFYSKDVASQSTSTEVYTHTETLTVWAGQTSKWVNSTSSGTVYTYNSTNNYYYLDVTTSMRTGIRSVFYIAGTNSGILSKTTTENGSIFYPFDSLKDAYDAITAVEYENIDYLIVVDGVLFDATNDDLTYALANTRCCTTTILGLGSAITDSFLALTKTGNSKLTLKNITVTGDVSVKADLLYLDNAILSGDTSLYTDSTNTDFDVAKYPIYVSGEDTVSTATISWNGATPSYNSILVKHIADANATDNGRLTSSHESQFTLSSSYSQYLTTYNRGLDSLSTANSYGDIILKRVTSITITDGSATTFVLSSSSSVSTLDVTVSQVTTDLTFTSTIQDGDGNTTSETISGIDAKVYSGSADVTSRFTIAAGPNYRSITLKPTSEFVNLVAAQQDTEYYTVTVVWTYNDREYSATYTFSVTPSVTP